MQYVVEQVLMRQEGRFLRYEGIRTGLQQEWVCDSQVARVHGRVALTLDARPVEMRGSWLQQRPLDELGDGLGLLERVAVD